MQVIEHAIHDHIASVSWAICVTLPKYGTWTEYRGPKLATLHPVGRCPSPLLELFGQCLLSFFNRVRHDLSTISSESHAVGVAVGMSSPVDIARSRRVITNFS